MITIKTKGTFAQTMKSLSRMRDGEMYRELNRFGQKGVDALSGATPVDTGGTARSWNYEVIETKGRPGIVWYNTNENDGVNIAILLQYGHGTGTGGWVAGYDYINPAIRPIFDQIADDVWKQVKML